MVLLSARCRHCDPVLPVTLPFPNELKPYVDFGVGSYWVYEDSATGRLDSTVLTNKVWGWDFDYAKNRCDEIYVRKKVETLTINYSIFQNGVFNRSYSIHRLYMLGSDAFDEFTELDDNDGWYIISYPLERPIINHTTLYDITQTKVDTVWVKSSFYLKPIKIIWVPTFGIKYFSSFDYYIPKLGRIKMTTIDTLNRNGNYTLNLIRYKIL